MKEAKVSMEPFIEQGASYADCLQKVRMKYGEKVTLMNFRSIRIGGIFGLLFARDGVEVTGYVSMKENGNANGIFYGAGF